MFVIPFDKILEKSFALRETNPDMEIADILKQVLPEVPIKIQSEISMNIRKKNISEEKEKTKEKKELTDENRCMARTFYEDNHLEAGLLKVMREDKKNLYGDRCKCRKKEEGHFCTRHSGWQSLGIWNGVYSGKLLDYVNKTENAECLIDLEPKKKTKKDEVKSEKIEKKSEKIQKEKSEKKIEKVLKNDPDLNEEESVDADPISIDGVDYYIDSENNLYSEDGDLIGIYNYQSKQILKVDNL